MRCISAYYEKVKKLKFLAVLSGSKQAKKNTENILGFRASYVHVSSRRTVKLSKELDDHSCRTMVEVKWQDHLMTEWSWVQVLQPSIRFVRENLIF